MSERVVDNGAESEAGEQKPVPEVAAPARTQLLAEALREVGYRGYIRLGSSSPWIESASQGYRFAVYPDWRDPPSVQFRLGILSDAYDLEQLNRFNELYRFAKLYLEREEGDSSVVMESDFLLPIQDDKEDYVSAIDTAMRVWNISISTLSDWLKNGPDD